MPIANAYSDKLSRLVAEDEKLGSVWRALFDLREGTTREIAERADVVPSVAYTKLRKLESLGLAKALSDPIDFDLISVHEPSKHYYLSADGYIESGVLANTR